MLNIETTNYNDEEMNRYKKALDKYQTKISDENVRTSVQKIISEKMAANNTKEVARFLLGCTELTSLNTTDNAEQILDMTEQVNRLDEQYPDLPHLAAICVYPNYAKIVSESLEIDDVQVTCVAGGFPSGQTFSEVKIAETALAIKDGATEIDIVMQIGSFLDGDYESLCDEIEEIKATCGDKKLKVILETGCLGTASNIKKAALLAMYAGADFIKTSTGKVTPTTPEAAYVMCQAIKEYYDQTGIQIGFKPAGGMKTFEDALVYYTIAKEVLGEKWLTNEWFRLGTSRLVNQLLSKILDEEINIF